MTRAAREPHRHEVNIPEHTTPRKASTSADTFTCDRSRPSRIELHIMPTTLRPRGFAGLLKPNMHDASSAAEAGEQLMPSTKPSPSPPLGAVLGAESVGLKFEYEENLALIEQVAAREMRVSKTELHSEHAEAKVGEEEKKVQQQSQALSQDCKGLTRKMAEASEECIATLEVCDAMLPQVTPSSISSYLCHLTPLHSSAHILYPPPLSPSHQFAAAQPPTARPPRAPRPPHLRRA